MKRSFKVVGSFTLFLFSLLAIQGIEEDYALKQVMTHALPHLIVVATAVIVGGILLWIVEESIYTYITPALLTGLRTLGTELAKEVRRFPESPSIKKIPDVIREFLSDIKSPEVAKLAAENRIEEALQKAEPDEKIVNVLLQSADPKDWQRAAKLLEEPKNQDPKYFLPLAYCFGSRKQISQAIAVAEKGLQLATQKDPALVPDFQDSLAYYYSDAQESKYEGLAREYIAAALVTNPEEPEYLDTEGFVKITFGKTRGEILEGVGLWEVARRRGVSFQLYAKHIARAQERLSAMPDRSRNPPAAG